MASIGLNGIDAAPRSHDLRGIRAEKIISFIEGSTNAGSVLPPRLNAIRNSARWPLQSSARIVAGFFAGIMPIVRGSYGGGNAGAHGRESEVIQTLVAEPTTLTREGLVSLLSREHDIKLIATVRRAEEVMPTALALKPDVALLAAAFPGHDGIDIARTLRAALPGCRCAILSAGRRPRDLRRAIAAHVHGFLVHDSPAEFLAEAIRQLASGNKVIDPGLTLSAPGSKACPLTTREAEALHAAAQGLTTAEIATSLCLTAGTVRNYLSRAIEKTGARNRVDAIRIADESGWL
jgi:two-component system response regulator DesR